MLFFELSGFSPSRLVIGARFLMDLMGLIGVGKGYFV